MTAVAETIAALRAQVRAWHREGLTVALVPTMGALHDGHISLMRAALERADRCVVSIFVNPRQFAPTEDLDKYPRQLEQDLARLAGAGVHLAFTPSVDEVYPEGFAASISVGGPSAGLESTFRPAFFDGVATVVGKLLIMATPDVAIFGEKDYQQLCVVRKLCLDLNLPVEIVGSATVRDAEGLAMSSRNAYLSSAELKIAQNLNKLLRKAAAALQAGTDERVAMAAARQEILDAGFDVVDYVEVRESLTLAPWQRNREGRVLVAAHLGKTRLIDNIEVAAS